MYIYIYITHLVCTTPRHPNSTGSVCKYDVTNVSVAELIISVELDIELQSERRAQRPPASFRTPLVALFDCCNCSEDGWRAAGCIAAAFGELGSTNAACVHVYWLVGSLLMARVAARHYVSIPPTWLDNLLNTVYS